MSEQICTCVSRADGIGAMHGHHDKQCPCSFSEASEGEMPEQRKCEVLDCNEPQTCFHYCQTHHQVICNPPTYSEASEQKDSAGEGVPERVCIDNPKLDTDRHLYSSPCPELEPVIKAVEYVRVSPVTVDERWPCWKCGALTANRRAKDGMSECAEHSHEAAARRAAEKIYDEPTPRELKWATFDRRKWKIDRFAEIILSEMKESK